MIAPRPIVLLLVFALHATQAGAQDSTPLRGLTLSEALRVMQSKGLRIVFSSAVVQPRLRVTVEPRGRTPRQQLDDLLAAHNLEAREGPGGILQIVRAESRAKTPPPGAPATTAPRGPTPVRTHNEYVTVTDAAPYRTDRGAIAEMSFERADSADLRGTLAEDPYRVVQAFPRVAAVGDFGSDFAVRGSPFRHVNQVIDGVSTPLLQHTIHGGTAAGSLSMVSGPVLDHVTLRTGAYPRRNADRLGSELELSIREGSRAGFALRGAIGGSHAMMLAEGPLATRGSWLVVARQSYLEWPPERSASSRTPFGFSDGVAKLAFDVGRTQQIAFTALGGTSVADVEDDVLPGEPGGSNTAAVFTLSWEARLPRSLVITQRGYMVRQRFFNRSPTLEEDEGASQQAGYRIDLTRPVRAGLLEAGAQIGRSSMAGVPGFAGQSAAEAMSSHRSGYAHFAWTLRRSITLSPGVRITSSTLVRSPAVSPWLLGEWSFRPSWTLNVSAGVSNQLPPLEGTAGDRALPALKAERARLLDIGVEHRPTATIRWQATVFSRREADILREPYVHPRVVNDALVAADLTRYDNALSGTAHGLELLVERRQSTGLSGWVSYSYGRARQTDARRGETYWSDFDQRHTFNVFAVYRLSKANVGGTFRAGSNFPLSGHFARNALGLVAGTGRNQIRLPPYVRLDLRADRPFQYLGRRLTPFVEVLNALDRVNTGMADGRVNPATGEAQGFTDVLLRRRLTAGIVIQF